MEKIIRINMFVDHTHYCKLCSKIGRVLVNNDVYVRDIVFD